MALDGGEIPVSVYTNLIDTVHEHMDLMHRYVALRKKALKVPELHMYDLYAPMVEEFEMKGIRNQFYFMVGGYFLTEKQAKEIGADCYTEDACNCAEKACRYLTKKDRKKKKH